MIRTRNREKGASAIEFALAMPIVFVILFGIFEFGLAFWYQQELTNAVRDGARRGIVMATPRKTATFITDAVKQSMTDVGLTNGSRTATSNACVNKGDTLTVTATYPTSFAIVSNLTKLLSLSGTTSAVAASKTLSATVSMQCE